MHQTIRRISDDFNGRWHFNTSAAALMELLNECLSSQAALTLAPRAFVADLQSKFVLLLHPFAPYIAHELWERLGHTSNLLKEPWPQFDPALAKEDEIAMAVQLNGKLRSHVLVPAEASDDQIREAALNDEKVKAAIDDKKVVKVIVVKGKLINIVVK